MAVGQNSRPRLGLGLLPLSFFRFFVGALTDFRPEAVSPATAHKRESRGCGGGSGGGPIP